VRARVPERKRRLAAPELPSGAGPLGRPGRKAAAPACPERHGSAPARGVLEGRRFAAARGPPRAVAVPALRDLCAGRRCGQRGG
ncbi:unnamed protein product, partial [Effrenium voratum]